MRVVATAGHVDHGKSTLVEALTGTNPDRFAEERRRGLTIDLGFAWTTLPSGAGIALVDVPGHVRFVKNMLAGVGAVDACLFVVDAVEGWKPQSEEHLRILELLGVAHGVVAITKADRVDDEEAALAHLDVREHVEGTFLEGSPHVLVSAVTGIGVDDLRAALDDLVATTPAASDRRRPRLWVDRSFAAKGSGTVVTGTLTGGWLAAGDAVVVGPLQRPARLRAIQTLGTKVDRIGPGNRVALNLNGVDHDEIARGDAVTEPARWHLSRMVDASLRVLASLGHVVNRHGAYSVAIGSGDFPARVRVLGRGERSIAPGATSAVRLHLSTALPLLPGDRYVLRESGRSETVGGGEILDVAPVLPASRADPDRSVDRVVREHGWMEVSRLELLTAEVRGPTLGRWIGTADAYRGLLDAVRAKVEQAGDLGLDVAALDDRERAALDLLSDVAVANGRAVIGAPANRWHDHPLLRRLQDSGASPPDPASAERGELRALVRNGLVVERDGLYFAATTVDDVARTAARLLRDAPDGFTVSQLREALDTSRKYALPLAAELDARGITRRRGDVRVAGPRLPAP